MNACYYYSRCNHYFGYRVRLLPAGAIRISHFGVIYFCYDGIYYRPYGNYYIVVRPPFGTAVSISLVPEHYFRPVQISYYNTVSYSYELENQNYDFIRQQNEIIAKNNEIIAQQQEIIAKNTAIIAGQNSAQATLSAAQSKALNQKDGSEAYLLAKSLGLVQSYADANLEYFYEDGVFYAMEGKEYKVIVPPAGARVETLPDDYELVTFDDGLEYYKVDDTIYMITIVEGKPYFEVLGQKYN